MSRKPHLLKVRTKIVALIDIEIGEMQNSLVLNTWDGFKNEEKEFRRELAIWIRQRNKIAIDADIDLIPLPNKDGQGKIIY